MGCCVGIEQSCNGDQTIPESVSTRAPSITRRSTTQNKSAQAPSTPQETNPTRTSLIEVPTVEPMAPSTANPQQQRNMFVPNSGSTSSLSYNTAPSVPTPKATLLPPVQQLPGFVRPAEIGRSVPPSSNAVTPSHGVLQQPVLHFHFQHAGMKGNADDAALLVHNLTMRSASSPSNAGSVMEGAPDSMLVMGGGGGRRGGGASVFPSFSLPGGGAATVSTTTTTATGLPQRGAPLLLPQSSSSGSGAGSSLQQSGAQLAAIRKLFPSPSMRAHQHSTSMDAVDGSSQCSRRSPSSGCSSALAQNPLQPFSLARHDPLAEPVDMMITGALPGGGCFSLPATVQASVHLMSSVGGGGGGGIPFYGDLSDLQSTGDFVMMTSQQQATSSLSILCQGHASASCDPHVEAALWGSPRAAPAVGGLLRSHVASRMALHRSEPRRRQTSFATDLSGFPLAQEASSLWDTDTLTLFDDSATVGGGGAAAIGAGGGMTGRGERKGWGGGSTGCDSFASGIGGIVGLSLLPINLPRFAEN